MPKRPVTPPPTYDEPKYLTVVHPYPLHAHMELPKDREDFGRWMACCIGPDPFYAFFHKPSAPNMVIVEVKRDFDGFDRLLGEHRWNEFLSDPSAEEEVKVTKVYYCVYNSGRQVQKNGWKRIDAQQSWFRGWSSNNIRINFPYPTTYYCDPPPEDQTNHPICRPLPSRLAPIPIVTKEIVRPPPPGSARWVSEKAANKVAPTRGAWTRGTPAALHIPTSTRGGKASVSAKTSSSPAKRGSSGGSSPWTKKTTSPMAAASSADPWHRSLSSSAFSAAETATSPTSSQNGMDCSSSVSCSSSPSIQTPLSALPVPPGLGSVPPRLPVSTSWADDIPPGLFPDVVDDANSSLPPIDDFAPTYSVAWNHPDVPENIEEAYAELETPDPVLGYASKWEYADNQQTKATELPVPVSGSLWDNYEEEKPDKEELFCTSHGRICKKGICKTYAKQLREAEKAKKMEERAKRMAENPKRDRGKGKDRGKGRGGHGDSDANWREGSSHGGGQEDGWPPASANLKNNNNSNGTSTSLNPSSADDDDDGFSVAASSKGSKRGRPRADSIESAAPSVASGWGTFSNGPW